MAAVAYKHEVHLAVTLVSKRYCHSVTALYESHGALRVSLGAEFAWLAKRRPRATTAQFTAESAFLVQYRHYSALQLDSRACFSSNLRLTKSCITWYKYRT